MPEPGREVGHGQLDAQQVLQFTERLRALHEQLDASRVSDEQRRRWQSRLAAISEGATTDLARAAEQLRRLEADMDRHGPA